MNAKPIIPALVVLALAACSSAPKKPAVAGGTRVQGHGTAAEAPPARVATGCSPYAPAQEDPSTRGNYTRGGLYAPGVKDTTPDHVPNVDCIPEPAVVDEPRSAIGNQSPYAVLGKTYKVLDDVHGYVETGTASYYGAKFHGRLTSNREVYDVNAFTAAHKTLPLPSFALVTNIDNGQSVVVRVNDRGPFHDDRLIDLSYAAAVKLGITGKGTGRVQVRALTPEDNTGLLAARRAALASGTALAAATPARPSRMDSLVGQLPAGASRPATAPATPAPASAPATAPAAPVRVASTAAAADSAGERWRYRVSDQAHPGNADNFDAWMTANGVRVATGKSTRLAAAEPPPAARAPSRAKAAAALPAPAPAPVPAAPVAMAAAPQPTPAQNALGRILLQVASFASRENANKALAQLASAGIAGASLSDIASGGRTLWRLRVAVTDHDAATELSGRIASLGLGRPQIVNE